MRSVVEILGSGRSDRMFPGDYAPLNQIEAYFFETNSQPGVFKNGK